MVFYISKIIWTKCAPNPKNTLCRVFLGLGYFSSHNCLLVEIGGYENEKIGNNQSTYTSDLDLNYEENSTRLILTSTRMERVFG
jgi:hypothetical protein